MVAWDQAPIFRPIPLVGNRAKNRRAKRAARGRSFCPIPHQEHMFLSTLRSLSPLPLPSPRAARFARPRAVRFARHFFRLIPH